MSAFLDHARYTNPAIIKFKVIPKVKVINISCSFWRVYTIL